MLEYVFEYALEYVFEYVFEYVTGVGATPCWYVVSNSVQRCPYIYSLVDTRIFCRFLSVITTRGNDGDPYRW